MSEEIIKVLDALAEKFGLAIDWTQENILPYIKLLCERLVKYELVTSVAWIIIAAIILVVSVLLVRYIYKEWDDDELLLGLMALAIIIAIMLGVLLYQAFDIIGCLVFPEKIIFQWCQTFLS